jgi:hypothetical protein
MRPFTVDRLTALLEDSPANTFWRHDVDVSPAAACRMAELEADMGIEATYYVMATSPFYSLMEAHTLVLALQALGHRVGLHADLRETPLVLLLDGSWRGVPVSFHCPSPYLLWGDFEQFESAYAARWEGRYAADSRGAFAQGDPEDRFDGEPLQVNLHPEWWFEPDWAARPGAAALCEGFFRGWLPAVAA